MRYLAVVSAALITAWSIFWFESLPHEALRHVYEAAARSDAQGIEIHADTVAIRSRFAEVVRAKLAASVTEGSIAANKRVQGVLKRHIDAAATAAADALTQPAGLANLLSDGVEMREYTSGWSSGSAFWALMDGPNGQARFELHRAGLKWKVVAISFPGADGSEPKATVF